jgi:NitT/TauT family transport system substrate-binding protein
VAPGPVEEGISSVCSYCDRNFPDISKIDLSRRSFLRNSALAAAAVTMAVPLGFSRPAMAVSPITLKSTHGGGICNAALFAAHANKLAAADGVTIEFVETPNFADMVTFIGMGQVDVSMMPYTSFMALYDAGAPVKIVAGGGVQGCALIARPGIDSPEKVKGKVLGTFQLDTLEVLPYDWLKKHGIKYSDVTVRYIGGNAEIMEAFKAGGVDIAAVIEPLATQLLRDVPGSVQLTDGVDLYGPDYTDCVFCARQELIDSNPGAIQAIIKAMLVGQSMWEQDRAGMIKQLVGPYYRLPPEDMAIAAEKQPVKVDQRAQQDFILGRVDSMMEMGYIKKKPGTDAINWSMLEAAIAEVPDVYAKLKHKSA